MRNQATFHMATASHKNKQNVSTSYKLCTLLETTFCLFTNIKNISTPEGAAHVIVECTVHAEGCNNIEILFNVMLAYYLYLWWCQVLLFLPAFTTK